MKRILAFLCTLALTMSAAPLSGQWLKYPTPQIPRDADGRPKLTAPTPRTADGHPDLTGLWRGPGPVAEIFSPDPNDVRPWAKQLARRHADDFFKSRPNNQCLPAGPESFRGFKRVLYTPGVVAILNEDLTYRQIFLDGRSLEETPHPVWMGYSVGRWEGDTLVVDSFGFNDRTWLNHVGLPHTEALRMRERYDRPDVGHLRIDVTFTDPAVFARPVGFGVTLELAADTEMIEAVCEVRSDHWTGSVSDLRQSAIHIAPEILTRYVGTYSGLYFQRMRTIHVTFIDGVLFVTGFFTADPSELLAQSDTLFTSAEGLSYQFIVDERGVTEVLEIHASGGYSYRRR